MPMPTMTTTAQERVAEQNAPVPQTPERDPKTKKRHQEFRARVDICKHQRKKLTQNWTISIDYRRNKPFQSQADSDLIAVPKDWSLTKTKIASMYSQTPEVRVSHPPDTAESGGWLGNYQRKLNDTMVIAGIEATMMEVLPDCINAAGFGAAIVTMETLSIEKEVPIYENSKEMTTVPEVVDKRYLIQRISPSDFLWPINFTGSDFNRAPWLGRSDRITWAEAVQKWNLTEEEKTKVLGEDRTVLDKLTHDVDKDKITADEMVGFDEIFYREFSYDPEARHFSAYHHLVFLNGKEEPVVDEAWKGQKVLEDGSLIGSLLCPLQVLTLAYMTDESIPPSDSAIGRSLVDELNESRSNRLKQRKRNLPVRWYDVNRIDAAIQTSLMRGTWQNMIPVQGDGTRVLGEVAKSGHTVEDAAFDEMTNSDLTETWTIGPNQLGSGANVETKGESNEIATGFQTRIGQERARVASFVVNLAKVLGGIMCMSEDPASFGEGFDPGFSRSLGFSVLADATVLVDANQKLERLGTFVNTYAKSGFVHVEPVLKEIAILSGLDPTQVIKAPDPTPPAEPNISLRLTGAEDMMNPLLLAFMIKSGQAPDATSIAQAKEMIQSAVIPTPPPLVGPDGQPMEGGVPPPGTAPDGQPMPPPPPTPIGEANPNMTILPKVAKRSDDPSAGGKE